MMDDGATAYASALKLTLYRLDSIHNAELRIALGAFRTSPIESIYAKTGKPSLHQRRMFLSLSHATEYSFKQKQVYL